MSYGLRSFLFACPLVLASCAAPTSGESVDDAQAASVAEACADVFALAPGAPLVFFPPFDDAEQKALCVLSTAKTEVVVAHYNIRSQRMLDALVALHQRGVQVSVAVDQSNAAESYNWGDDFLEASGIPLVRVKPAGDTAIMHLKTTVVDGETVMTGSFNWNNSAAHANDENMIVLRDPALAARYRDEVLEVQGRKARTVDGGVVAPGVELHFSPEEKLDTVIQREIDAATSTVDVAMFTFTMSTVAKALEKAAQRGVQVRMVVERKQCGLSFAEDKVEAAGGLVVRGANKIGEFSAMHQKYAVIDGHRVITGATNWTYTGTRVSEEDLLVLDSEQVALAYRRNFADLLQVYGRLDITASDPALQMPRAGAFFRVVNDTTDFGDRTVVVGNLDELGGWNPDRGIDTDATELYPSWTGRARLPAGAHVEYKFVVIKPWGEVRWESGPNRMLDVPATGRAVVISGTYGNTASNWTPAD